MAKYKSGVQVMVDPSEFVIGKNSRFDGIDMDHAESLAVSFEKHGQRQAVQARYVGEDLTLVFGFHRHAAAVIYNERNPNNPMKVKCVVTSCNDEEAFQFSVIENKERNQTNAMDDAVNQRRFREEFGWTNVRIAELYRCSPSYVSQIEKLLTLPRALQVRIKERTLSVKAGLDMAELSSAEQQEVLSQEPVELPMATIIEDDDDLFKVTTTTELPVSDHHESNGKAEKSSSFGARVAEKVRNKKIDQGGSKSRNLSELRKGLTEIKDATESEQVKKLIALTEKYIGGLLKTTTMQAKLEALFQ